MAGQRLSASMSMTRLLIVFIVIGAQACVHEPMPFDISAPHACDYTKASAGLGVLGAAGVVAAASQGVDPEDNVLVVGAIIGVIGGAAGTAVFGGSCIRQLHGARERLVYHPRPMTPQQRKMLDEVRAEEAP